MRTGTIYYPDTLDELLYVMSQMAMNNRIVFHSIEIVHTNEGFRIIDMNDVEYVGKPKSFKKMAKLLKEYCKDLDLE